MEGPVVRIILLYTESIRPEKSCADLACESDCIPEYIRDDFVWYAKVRFRNVTGSSTKRYGRTPTVAQRYIFRVCRQYLAVDECDPFILYLQKTWREPDIVYCATFRMLLSAQTKTI